MIFFVHSVFVADYTLIPSLFMKFLRVSFFPLLLFSTSRRGSSVYVCPFVIS